MAAMKLNPQAVAISSGLTIGLAFLAALIATHKPAPAPAPATKPPASAPAAANAPASQPQPAPAAASAPTSQPPPASDLAPWPPFTNLPFNVGMQYSQYVCCREDANAGVAWRTPFVWALQSDNGGSLVQPVLMRQWAQGSLIGRYWSACTVWYNAPQPFLPEPSAPAEFFTAAQMSLGSWSQQAAARRYVDIRTPEVRAKLVKHFIENAQAAGYKALSIDNLSLGMKLYAWNGAAEVVTADAASWTAGNLAFITDLAKAAHGGKLRVVVNVAMNDIPNDIDKLLAAGVDGILNELPMHPNTTERPDWAADELNAYRRCLDRGVFVGLVPYCKTSPTLTACEELNVAAALLIGNPGDPIGVSEMSYKPESREWFGYMSRLGPPKAKGYVRNAEEFSREFQNGRVRVKMARSPVVAFEF